MSENERDLIEQMHREAVERFLEEKEQQRAVVQAMHQQALEQYREEQQRQQALVEQMHREALEQLPRPVPAHEPPTILYTELPEARPDSPLYRE